MIEVLTREEDPTTQRDERKLVGTENLITYAEAPIPLCVILAARFGTDPHPAFRR